MKKSGYFSSIICTLLVISCVKQEPSVINIELAKNGVTVPQGLWGIFYEEINRAGDGGLWPEKIYNMGFEEKSIPPTCTVEDNLIVPPANPNYLYGRVRDYKFHHFDPNNLTEGWDLENKGNSKSAMKVVTDKPLHKANPHSLLLKIDAIDGEINLINNGFKGISFFKNEKYNFSFYLRADKSYNGNVVASIVDKEGDAVFTKKFEVNNTGAWTNYKSEITSGVTDNGLKLVLQFTSTGEVWIDYVSLLPQKTFKGHGLRTDIAQTLANLKPSFIRWPGGCVVEGFTIENRIKWKETIGERLTRPGEFDMWGYHNTYNFGYHDFLQFCEDVGAVAMYVANAGLSCSFRNGDYYEMDQMESIVQDALDAIEYAIGGIDTKWGAIRAKNGHPEPFPLKYMEIGNENHGPKYGERYNMIYAACKEKYPDIVYINNNSLTDNMPDYYADGSIEMIDPHYYVAPETFFKNAHLYDTVPRGNFDVYIGEYAVNSNVGTGNLYGALAEAAFMFGIEHNSDLIKIASYAPLLENVNWRHWPVNLIRFKNDSVYGRSSYYVQKMFNENKPDVTLETTLDLKTAMGPISGKVGFAATSNTNNSNVVVKKYSITVGDEIKYSSNFPGDSAHWVPRGSWAFSEKGLSTGKLKDLSYLNKPGLYIPGNPKEGDGQVRLTGGGSIVLNDIILTNCTISADILRDSIFNGFSIRFGVVDDENYFSLTIRSPRRRWSRMQNNATQNEPVKYSASVEHVLNGTTMRLGNIGDPFDFAFGKPHNVKVGINGDTINCMVDDTNLGKLDYQPLQRQYAVAGYDKSNQEIIVKVVNGENIPFNTVINLSNTKRVEPDGQIITLSSVSPEDENSFAEPKKVSPVTSEYKKFGNSFNMEFKPNSFTILRIKAIR